MADPQKKTFTDFVKQGPDPVDDARVTEFAQRSQDPRARPWEALRRGGARLDAALGTGPASRRSRASELVENYGRFLSPPNDSGFGPEVGQVRSEGHFEGLARRIPEALGNPVLQAMAFPTGDHSFGEMKNMAVLRDALEARGAVPIDPAPTGLPQVPGETPKSWSQFAKTQRIGAAMDANSQARSSARLYGQDVDFSSVNTASDPTLDQLRDLDINSSSPIHDTTPEAVIPAPSNNPERMFLEAYLSKLIGGR